MCVKWPFCPHFYSGRELFLSDASVFVDDAEAYEKYHREEETDKVYSQVPIKHVSLRKDMNALVLTMP